MALNIGRRVTYTDSSGRFMLRLNKRASFPFSIAPEEFIANGVYQVVSAPSEVHSEAEDDATDVQVVVRRVPAPQAKLYRQSVTRAILPSAAAEAQVFPEAPVE